LFKISDDLSYSDIEKIIHKDLFIDVEARSYPRDFHYFRESTKTIVLLKKALYYDDIVKVLQPQGATYGCLKIREIECEAKQEIVMKGVGPAMMRTQT